MQIIGVNLSYANPVAVIKLIRNIGSFTLRDSKDFFDRIREHTWPIDIVNNDRMCRFLLSDADYARLADSNNIPVGVTHCKGVEEASDLNEIYDYVDFVHQYEPVIRNSIQIQNVADGVKTGNINTKIDVRDPISIRDGIMAATRELEMAQKAVMLAQERLTHLNAALYDLGFAFVPK